VHSASDGEQLREFLPAREAMHLAPILQEHDGG
jgi:hypothetical protein